METHFRPLMNLASHDPGASQPSSGRRRFMLALAALACRPSWALSPGPIHLAAAWQTTQGYQVGILEARAGQLAIHCAIDVPTRAHGLLQEADGNLLAVARRPGNWLLRFNARGQVARWHWSEPQRAYTGHLLADGERVYSTETDQETGAGLIGVRAAHSLEKLDEWPTHGVDPHQMVWHGRRIIVANGGIPTRPETGRLKRDLAAMDSSLVSLDADHGELLGQWRLDDNRLSMRHLTWNDKLLGIALQAEHSALAAKASAPVLAVFDGTHLRPCPASRALAGYGGDIAPAGAGFAVSCPRSHGIALFSGRGDWLGLIPLDEACALAKAPGGLWIGGRRHALTLQMEQSHTALPDIRLDNHWMHLA